MPQTYLFDLDGTLIDSLPDIAASANHVRRHFGLPLAELDTIRSYIGDGLAALLERSLGATTEDRFEEALALYRDHHDEQCVRLVQPYPGVAEWLATWHAAGHPMGVVTNKPADFSLRILQYLELDRYFGCVIGGDSTPARKPDPTPVRAALDELGSDGEAWMIGDSPADLLAGKRAGIRTAAVLYGYRSEADLREIGADAYWPAFGIDEVGSHG